MKVYIGNSEINDESYKQIADPNLLQFVAEDAECTVIILNGILRRYNLSQVQEIIKLCRQKLRLGGILKIIDVDFDLLIYVYGKLGNIVDLNNAVMTTEIRSFLTFDLVVEIIKSAAPDLANINFSQIQNVEFDVEFVRK